MDKLKEKIIVIGAGDPGNIASAIASQVDKTEKELIVMDGNFGGEYIKELKLLPELPLGFIEKKKKKPCESHQYTLRTNGKWICRHCNRDMNAE